MDSGNTTGHAVSHINVTPLIDVLLVLLIIFMVIVPVTPKGLRSSIPQPSQKDVPAPEDTIVVQVLAGANGEPSYRINETPLAKAQVESELARIFALRQSRVMFVQGDTALDFSKIAEVIDMGHQANVDSVGLITSGLAADQ
jgi:biopolymer transport protein ExbD/biopolymer transport protein TolR